jgi:transcriptional regulator with XRE-family HTH domain
MTSILNVMQLARQATISHGAIERACWPGAICGMAKKRDIDPATLIALLENQVETLRYIPEWLRFRGLKQKHIANALEVSEGLVSRYLTGKTQMTVGMLRKIAVLLRAHPGDVVKPPPAEGLGPLMEDTISEIDRLGPEEWGKVLAIARAMRGKTE